VKNHFEVVLHFRVFLSNPDGRIDQDFGFVRHFRRHHDVDAEDAPSVLGQTIGPLQDRFEDPCHVVVHGGLSGLHKGLEDVRALFLVEKAAG
jgi:hypothetical protein